MISRPANAHYVSLDDLIVFAEAWHNLICGNGFFNEISHYSVGESEIVTLVFPIAPIATCGAIMHGCVYVPPIYDCRFKGNREISDDSSKYIQRKCTLTIPIFDSEKVPFAKSSGLS